MSVKDRGAIPPVTIVIEWENAIDVDDVWTARAMTALQDELFAVAAHVTAPPRVTYLFDQTRVVPGIIDSFIEKAAPHLRELADVELVPAPGLSYYKLKNLGIDRSTTDITVVLDSDAAPEAGWLESLVKPFDDPRIMVVAGFTCLAHDDLVSRAMALSWFFDLPEEATETERRLELHANNFAVRTEFFRGHPFPDLPLFKRHCSFWLRDILAQGHGFLRTSAARAIHAPHPGFKYLMWRGRQSGSDRDYQVFQEKSRSRIARVGYALAFFIKKTLRSWSRILTKGSLVNLPLWQRPAAMVVALCYYGMVASAELRNALTRSYKKREAPEAFAPDASQAQAA